MIKNCKKQIMKSVTIVMVLMTISSFFSCSEDSKIETTQPVVIGDYLFIDGTWGTLADNPNKTAIAVIFSTTTSSTDQKNGWTHGYAMALNSVDAKWSASGQNENLPKYDVTKMLDKDDKDGYTQTQTIVTSGKLGFSKTNYPAFWEAINYSVAAPKNTSGWFLPSCGQFCDLITNLGKGTMNQTFLICKSTNPIVENLNQYFKKGTNFNEDDIYWLTGQWISGSMGTVIVFNMNSSNNIVRYANTKTVTYKVRPTIAF